MTIIENGIHRSATLKEQKVTLDNIVKQLQRKSACLLNYFKHGLHHLMVKGILSFVFPKCTDHSLPRLFIEQITGMMLSRSSLALNYLMVVDSLVGSQMAEYDQLCTSS